MIFEGQNVQYNGVGERDIPLRPGDQGMVILSGDAGSYVHWETGECADHIGLIRNSALRVVAEQSWDTHEVITWFDNDEALYWPSLEAASPDELKDMWNNTASDHKQYAFSQVDQSNVDWQEVYDHIHMDDDFQDDEDESADIHADDDF